MRNISLFLAIGMVYSGVKTDFYGFDAEKHYL